MSPLMILGAIIGLPLALLIILRVKPLYAFVSIVTGFFWVQYLGSSVQLIAGPVLPITNPEVPVRLVLLLLPVLLTLVIMRKTLSASALPFQLILLVANSLLLATFLVPLLTSGLQNAIYQTPAGSIFRQSHDVLISLVAGLHLAVMLFMKLRERE